MRAYVALALVFLALMLEVNSASLKGRIFAHLRLRRQQIAKNAPNVPAIPELPEMNDYNPFLPDPSSKTNPFMTCVTSSIYHCHGCFFNNGQCCCPNANTYDDLK